MRSIPCIHQGVTIVFENKWYSFKPISYVGLILAIVGIVGQRLYDFNIGWIKASWFVLFMIGLYLIVRGRRKHGL